MVFGVFELFAKHLQNVEKSQNMQKYPIPSKKLNFQDFQTIGGRSWKLLHSNPQNDAILEDSSDKDFF